ncbi:MAG TPA: efflux RND transporter periplasmic adaptor subunit [Bryobacteraceae bacterium]|nr:efflux RND transporter periplasmic adaptor subunit [Bryobacteraceae bacterium]
MVCLRYLTNSRRSLAWGSGICLFALLWTGCTSEADSVRKSPKAAPPVVLATATVQDVPIEVRAIGNGEAYSSVAVKAQIAGQLMKVYFKEGADVKKGDMLFQIDPRPLQNQIAEMKATIAKDQATEQQAEAAASRDRSTAENARAQAGRYANLFKQGIVSREQNDQLTSAAQSAEDAVRADEANLAAAKQNTRVDESKLKDAELQLSYTSIVSPINGRTGTLNFKEGNLIKDQADTPLVIINQINPIYVTFAVPEGALREIRENSAKGKLKVEATPQGSSEPETGVLDFIDNTVDASTGTIKLKGLFTNARRRLWPGQFVNVALRLGTRRNAVLAPTAAVQAGQKGKYVLVVDANQIAHERQVTAGAVVGNDTVIESGLTAGERVIIDGQMAVVNGAQVAPVQRGPASGAQGQ